MLTHTSGHAEKLYATAIELGLEVQLGNIRTPTHFPYNGGQPSIIDLVFLHAGPTRATICVGNRGPSDHCFVSTVIPFGFSLEPGPKQIKPGSDEESEFLGLVSDHLSSLPIPDDDGEVSAVVSQVVDAVASAWSLVVKASRVCMRLKSWWSEDCAHAKHIALKVNTKPNWITLNKVTKRAKRKFFNDRITEISEKIKRPWNLMDWVGPWKMPPMEAITFKGWPCLSSDAVWSALHTTFNSAIDRDTDMSWVFPGLLVTIARLL